MKPFSFELGLLTYAIIFTVISTGLALWFVRTKELNWKEGIMMLLIYVIFIAAEWFFGAAG
jgi:hypothetical protein